MNETIYPNSAPGFDSTGIEKRSRVRDTSMPASNEKEPPPALDLLDDVVQGAHDTVDAVSERAAPIVRQLGESAAQAEAALHAKTAQLRVKRDEWVEGARTTVRCNPLASVAAALALGAVLARFIRR